MEQPSTYGAPIHLGRPIQLGLPFTIYELRLTQRLLENLQAVSRFLLRALATGASVDTICEITALSRNTIEAQYDYLRKQGYLSEEFTLTDLGQQMVEIETLLPEFVAHVGVDNFCGKNIFVLPSHDTTPLPFPADVRVPENRFISQFIQQAAVGELLLSDGGADLLKFLTYFWPDHVALFEGQLRYLDFKLVRLPGHHAETVSVNVDDRQLTAVSRLRPEEAGAILPVLDIERKYSNVDGYPWPPATPPSDRTYIELFGHALLADDLPYTEHADAPVRILPLQLDCGDEPSLAAASVPMGLTVSYRVNRRYLNVRVEGSLMNALRERYPYLILGDDNA